MGEAKRMGSGAWERATGDEDDKDGKRRLGASCMMVDAERRYVRSHAERGNE
jgi:hypothetical protein